MKGVERIYPNSDRYGGKTFAHHKARYEFALRIRENRGLALDLGCGAGYGTEMLRLAGYQTLGVDISQEAIEYADKHYPDNRFETCKIRSIDWTMKLDLVTFFEVLEHLSLEDGVVAIQSAGKALNDGGIFVMSIPRDINKRHNGFHLSHWGFEMLVDVLCQSFTYVKMYGQNWDTAEITENKVKKNDFYIAVCKND